MASPMIELRNVSLTFDRDPILSKVNLTVYTGEKLVVIGPSGHGKSALLKIMCGLIRPTSGEVFIAGRNLAEMSSNERVVTRRKMGMLFQKNALFDSLTCYENVLFPLHEVTQLTAEAAHQKVMGLLESVGLAQAHHLYPDEISGGMQKRLGIARALALQPEIIFYDDPTAGLDPITSRKIIDLLISLQKENNSTLVSITNDMNRAYQLADQIVMVANGQLMVAGSPIETQKNSNPVISNFIRGLSFASAQ